MGLGVCSLPLQSDRLVVAVWLEIDLTQQRRAKSLVVPWAVGTGMDSLPRQQVDRLVVVVWLEIDLTQQQRAESLVVPWAVGTGMDSLQRQQVDRLVVVVWLEIGLTQQRRAESLVAPWAVGSGMDSLPQQQAERLVVVQLVWCWPSIYHPQQHQELPKREHDLLADSKHRSRRTWVVQCDPYYCSIGLYW
jgi:tripartite-type tricarboxylate transporter receptor subunit TctC